MSALNCPQCGTCNTQDGALQGALGDRAQLRCRFCGQWWSVPVEDLDPYFFTEVDEDE